MLDLDKLVLQLLRFGLWEAEAFGVKFRQVAVEKADNHFDEIFGFFVTVADDLPSRCLARETCICHIGLGLCCIKHLQALSCEVQ